MEHTIKDVEEIDNLQIPYDVSTNIKYISSNFEYNLLVINKEKFSGLTVLSNGAVNQQKKAPPVFMRSKWAEDIESKLIYLDDPTIHKTNLSLGWGQGNKDEFVLKEYSEIVKAISKKLNILDSKVCYYGSSAGGFMSMILSSMHKDSFAVVNNPQTDIKSYYQGHSSPLLSLCYGDVEEAYSNYEERVNIVSAFKNSSYIPKVYYIQNQYSTHDLKFHVNPFIKLMKEEELDIEKIIFINYFDKEKGHTPLDKLEALKSLNLLIKVDIF